MIYSCISWTNDLHSIKMAGVDKLRNSLLSSFQMGAEVDKPKANQVTYGGVFL